MPRFALSRQLGGPGEILPCSRSDLRKVAESKRAQCCEIVAGPRVDWLCTATGGSRNPLLPALHHQ